MLLETSQHFIKFSIDFGRLRMTIIVSDELLRRENNSSDWCKEPLTVQYSYPESAVDFSPCHTHLHLRTIVLQSLSPNLFSSLVIADC